MDTDHPNMFFSYFPTQRYTGRFSTSKYTAGPLVLWLQNSLLSGYVNNFINYPQ